MKAAPVIDRDPKPANDEVAEPGTIVRPIRDEIAWQRLALLVKEMLDSRSRSGRG